MANGTRHPDERYSPPTVSPHLDGSWRSTQRVRSLRFDLIARLATPTRGPTHFRRLSANFSEPLFFRISESREGPQNVRVQPLHSSAAHRTPHFIPVSTRSTAARQRTKRRTSKRAVSLRSNFRCAPRLCLVVVDRDREGGTAERERRKRRPDTQATEHDR